MKKVVLVVLSVCLLVLAGCDDGSGSTPGIYEPYTGALMPVDGAGALTEDVVYTWSNGGYNSYKSDGTFEFIWVDFEDTGDDEDNDSITGEGWVQTGGMRGTYTYNPATYELKRTITAWYETDKEGSVGTGIWVPEDSTGIDTEYCLLTEHQYCELLLFKGAGVWVSTSIADWSGTEDDGTPWTYKGTHTRTITITSDTFRDENKSYEERNNDGVLTEGTSKLRVREGKIHSSTSSSALSDGIYASYQLYMTTDTEKEWDFNHETGIFDLDRDKDNLDPGDRRSYTFLGVGEYIMEIDSTWNRSLR